MGFTYLVTWATARRAGGRDMMPRALHDPARISYLFAFGRLIPG